MYFYNFCCLLNIPINFQVQQSFRDILTRWIFDQFLLHFLGCTILEKSLVQTICFSSTIAIKQPTSVKKHIQQSINLCILMHKSGKYVRNHFEPFWLEKLQLEIQKTQNDFRNKNFYLQISSIPRWTWKIWIFERKLKKAWVWSGFELQTPCMSGWSLTSRPTKLVVKSGKKLMI